MSKVLNNIVGELNTSLIASERLDLYINLKQYLLQCDFGEPSSLLCAAPEIDRPICVYKYPQQSAHHATSHDIAVSDSLRSENKEADNNEWLLFAVPYRGTETVDAEIMVNYLAWIKKYITSNHKRGGGEVEGERSSKKFGYKAFVAVVDSSSSVVMFRARPGMRRNNEDVRREQVHDLHAK